MSTDQCPGLVTESVALVPPLAFIGITLQLAEWQMSVGALLLFMANVVGIVIAAAMVVVIPIQFGRGNVLPPTDATEEVVAVVEVEVENGVTEIDIVVASSLAAPSVGGLAARLAEFLSTPVHVRLLLVSSETDRASVVPFP